MIDAVFISHWDTDHVNGIPSLLAGTRTQRIYIPETSFAERAIGLLAQPDNVSGNDSLEQVRFLASAIIDPTGTLRNLGAEQVITVIPDGEPPMIPEELSTVENEWRWTQPSSGDGQSRNHPSRHPVALHPLGGVIYIWMPQKPREVLERGYFAPYQEDFTKKLAELIKVSSLDKAKEMWEHLRSSIREKWHATKPRIDANMAGMALYVGQIPNSSSACTLPGFLGTGDLPFTDQQVIDKFKADMRDFLSNIMVVQAPHHGADSGGGGELEKILHPPIRWLISSNPDHKSFGHPSETILKALIKRGGQILQSTKDPETTISLHTGNVSPCTMPNVCDVFNCGLPHTRWVHCNLDMNGN